MEEGKKVCREFTIIPIKPWVEGDVKNSGGNFPYISYCLGNGVNGLIYGPPGAVFSFSEMGGCLRFGCDKPMFVMDPHDIATLANENPDLFSSFYEGKKVEYGRLHTILQSLVMARKQAAVHNIVGVMDLSIPPDMFCKLLSGLRQFSEELGFPISVWCIPSVILKKMWDHAVEINEEIQDKCGHPFDPNLLYLLTLRMIVMSIVKDDYGRWCIKNEGDQIVDRAMLEKTELFKVTAHVAYDNHSAEKISDLHVHAKAIQEGKLKLEYKNIPNSLEGFQAVGGSIEAVD